MVDVTRRDFLRVLSVAGGGLALGWGVSGCGPQRPWPGLETDAFRPNAFLQIRPDGEILLFIHRAEMGQGIMTGFATLVAEELEVDPRQLRFAFAEPHPDFADGNGVMVTGGSSSIFSSFEPLRHAAATARQMLLLAAAKLWQVQVSDCVASAGRVALRDGSRGASYGELAQAASGLPVPADVALKTQDEWRLIGKHDARVDAQGKVDGSAQYAIDVQIPGMLTGVLLRCPHFGGSLKRFDASAALQRAGVRQVLAVDGAIAVLADGYWVAREAASAVVVEWDKGPLGSLDSAAIIAEQQRLLDHEQGRIMREDGAADADASSHAALEAEYRVPYLAHATMEPMNATATVTPEGVEIWAGNQAPDVLQKMIARSLDISAATVRVHSMLLGGGFGRRAELDFALEAVAVARAAKAPVKLIWSREDDMRHDHYRPAVLTRLRASFDDSGALRSWSQRLVGPSIMSSMVLKFGAALLPNWMPGGVLAPVGKYLHSHDETSVEGAVDMPYRTPHVKVEFVYWDPGVPVGVWRSVGHSQNAFFTESFADEVAARLKQDPLEFRLSRLPEDSRLRGVLRLAAEKAGWGQPARGRFQGIAAHQSFGTYIAEVVEVSVEAGRIRVQRVVGAIDCGIVINPDIVRGQLESAVVFGLSAALHGEITLREGAVVQGSFDDYPVLRIDECPAIEAHLVASSAAPTGIGEPGVPPLAPALANAVFAATGQRLRSLPLRLG